MGILLHGRTRSTLTLQMKTECRWESWCYPLPRSPPNRPTPERGFCNRCRGHQQQTKWPWQARALREAQCDSHSLTQTEQLMKIWHTQIDRELNETFRKTAKLQKWRSHPQRTAISLSLHTIVSHTPESTRAPLLVFINTLGRVALSLLACHKLSATFTRRSSRLLFI